MIKPFYIPALIFLATLSACKKNNIHINNSIDHDRVWINSQTVQPFEKAHSGVLVSIVDSVRPYSFGYANSLKEIDDKPIKKVKVTAWVYIENAYAKGTLVIELAEGNKNAGWVGTVIDPDKIRLNTWQQISAEIEIPNTIDKDLLVKAYVWNKSKEKIFMDDMDLVFEQ